MTDPSVFNPAARTARRTRAARSRRLPALVLASLLAPVGLTEVPKLGALFAVARAEARENLTIDRIEIPNKAGAVILSGITITGSSLSRAEVEAIFKAEAVAELADRVEKFDADKLVIASIEWRIKNNAQEIRTIYEGFEATGIKAGRVERTIIRSGTQNATTTAGDAKPIASVGKFGRMSVEAFDLAGILRWVTVGDPAGTAPMKPLYGRYELDSIEFSADDVTSKIGRVVASGFKARLLKRPFLEFFGEIEKAAAAGKDGAAAPEAGLGMLAAVIDMYSAFEFGEGSVDGARFAFKDRKTGQQVTGSVGRITYGGGGKPGFLVNDIEGKAPDGAFRMKKFGFDGDGYAVALAMMQTAIAGLNDTPSPAETELRKAIAETAGRLKTGDLALKIEGIDGDFPPAKDAKSKERVKFSLSAFDFTLGSFVGVTPTRIDYALSGFKIPIPADTRDEGIRTLRELGIDAIDLSARIKGTWDEAKNRFLIDDVNADLGKVAKVGLRGELGGIPRPFFENPKENWVIALTGGNVQSVTVAIDNKGGIEKLIAKTAKEQKKTPDQFRLELSGIAPVMVATFLAGHPDANALAEALTAFIKAPASLSVTARAASPSGIPMMEIAGAANDPTALLGKIRIDASAR